MHDPFTIRDLVNDPGLRAILARDPATWDQVCVAMDVLSDRGHLPDQLDAANCLGRVGGLAPFVAAASQADLDVALEAVGGAIEARVRSLHQEFARNPLAAKFTEFKDLGYATEKISKIATDPIPASGYLPAVRVLAEKVRVGLNERGLWGDEETSEILSAVRRLTAFSTGEPQCPSPEDAALIARNAVPVLLKRLRDIANEVDAEDRRW